MMLHIYMMDRGSKRMNPLTLSEFKEHHLSRLLNGARARTKKHDWDQASVIRADDLIMLWKKCEGRCAISGRHFSYGKLCALYRQAPF